MTCMFVCGHTEVSDGAHCLSECSQQLFVQQLQFPSVA